MSPRVREEAPPLAETYYAGAYWLARRESPEACARRAERFFHLLGGCDPAWSGWHDTAATEEQERLLHPDAATFLRMFGRKKNQQLGGGVRFHLWVGETPPTATAVGARCGASTLRMPSVCVMELPNQGPVAERVLNSAVLGTVLRAMALAWEPDWAVATSYEHQARLMTSPAPDTFVGWVMYFSRKRGTVPPLPAPVRVEPVEDQGTLVTLIPERFTASNPEHVALAARVQVLLEGAGLLRPLQPLGPGA